MMTTARARRRVGARVALATAVTLAAAACQPADDPAVLEAPEDAVAAEDDGAGQSPVPGTLDELLAESDAIANEWHDDVRAVEVLVELTPERDPRRARVTYLAGEADRFLTVEIGEQGPSEERHALASLGLDAVDEAGLDAIPAMPADVRDADVLAESAAPVLDECGFDTAVESVLYTSGAPTAWDGREWASELLWTATARVEDGNAVTLDPVDASPADDPCVTPPDGT